MSNNIDTSLVIQEEPTFVVEDFLLVFPEFKHIATESIQFTGDIAYELLPHIVWGDKWHSRACYLLTAHNLAMRFPIDGIESEDGSIIPLNDVNNTIQITSHSAGTGSLSESGSAIYSNSDSAFLSNLSQTRYGIQLLSLMELVMPCGYLVKSKSRGIR